MTHQWNLITPQVDGCGYGRFGGCSIYWENGAVERGGGGGGGGGAEDGMFGVGSGAVVGGRRGVRFGRGGRGVGG